MASLTPVATASHLLRFFIVFMCIGVANAFSSPNLVELSTHTRDTGSMILCQPSWIFFQLIFIYTTTLPRRRWARIAGLFLLETCAILAACCVLEEESMRDALGQNSWGFIYALFVSFKLILVLGCPGILKLPRCGICNNENCDGNCGGGPSRGGDDANV